MNGLGFHQLVHQYNEQGAQDHRGSADQGETAANQALKKPLSLHLHNPSTQRLIQCGRERGNILEAE